MDQHISLRDNEEEYLSHLILSQSSYGILVTDNNFNIQWVNQSFEKVTGYCFEDVKGKPPRMLGSGQHETEYQAEMWRQIKSKGVWQGEIWSKRKSGEIYPELLNFFALKDGDGNILRYAGLLIDLTDVKPSDDPTRHKTYFDHLTELATRDNFIEYLGSALKSDNRKELRFAILFIGLDEFKNINGSLGHEMGDRYLKFVAGRLKNQLRESDFIARLGGNEFCIIINDATNADVVGKIAGHCLDGIQKPLKFEGQVFEPKASIGIAFYPEDSQSESGLLEAADSALYEAKRAGKHRYEFYNRKVTKQAEMRKSLEKDLQFAIERKQFVLHYQPKVNIRNGQMTGVEALIRWQHPKRGLISPDNFISMAEHLDMIDDIGMWVMETACKQLLVWQTQGIENLTMAVNVASCHFVQNNFVEDVLNILSKTGLPPELLELEITESMARNVKSHIKTCEKLINAGLHISIDDFGTGYSSLSVLKHLPVNTLKIDKTFIDDLLDDRQAATMLGGIVAIAEGLNFNTVIEGVETREQLIILYGLGCKLVQGYFFSKPVIADEIPLLVNSGFSHLMSKTEPEY